MRFPRSVTLALLLTSSAYVQAGPKGPALRRPHVGRPHVGRVLLDPAAAQQVPSGAAAQQSPASPRKGGNPDAAKLVSPVVASPESISAGRRAYTQFCANCHGATGKGDGRGAPAGTQVPDLTDMMWDYGSTDGDIFAVIHDGVSADMGPYAERMKDADIWNVVNYIRALAANK